MNRIITYILLVFLCIFLESFPSFDYFFQKLFFTDNTWLVSKAFHKSYGIWLYTTPKICIAIIAFICLAVFLRAFIQQTTNNTATLIAKPALLIFLCIIFVPLITASLKSISGVYSPIDLQLYGRQHIHSSFISHIFSTSQTATGRSFPAGHASGGFALTALHYLPVTPLYKKLFFILGIIIGWLMGFYQMARGEHFFSHTLTSMFLSLTIITCLAQLFTLYSHQQLPAFIKN